MEYYKNLDLADIKYFCEFDLEWKIEQWKSIIDYNGLYQVSDLGRVKSYKCLKGKKTIILRQSVNTDGYCVVVLCDKKIRIMFCVHQLVSIAFLNHILDKKFLLVVNHKNFIRSDNRKLNLEIITMRENTNKKHIKSTSQYVGVFWNKSRNKWQVQMVVNREKKHLGYFFDEIDAHNAYQNHLKLISNG